MSANLLKFLGVRGGDAHPPADPKISDRYADVPLANQFGEAVRFRDFVDGRALVINTMFTVCRGTCPGTSATLGRLRDALSPVFGDRLTFLSITLEPEGDTPAELWRYASIYGAGRRRRGVADWHFLTGKPGDIDRLRRSLGFYDLDPRLDADITSHASTLLFGNSQSDRWASLPAALREPLLVESIRRVAGFSFEQRYGIKE